MVKKKELTLQDLFNKMDIMYSDMINNFETINTKLDYLYGKPQPDEEKVADIPNTEYITITADDVYVGDEPATEYNGEKIYNLYHLPAYFKEIRDMLKEEYGYELLEIHCLQSLTDGKYAESGYPIPDKSGTNCWCRCVWKDKNNNIVSPLSWVFYGDAGSASYCAFYCAYNCAYYVRYRSDFRRAVFGGSGA